MEPALPNHRFGKYEILGRLGRGGMADVFRARVISGPLEGTLVAIKRLLPELAHDPISVDQFTTEADLSRWLCHPSIVRVLEVGVLGEVYFMVMEWVDGRDLWQLLSRCRKRGILMPIPLAVHVTRVVLDALGFAHQVALPSGQPLGLVHCDVSPSNVFISRMGEVKLGDFGVARGRLQALGLDSDAPIGGKPFYLSAELLEGAITPGADLWAAAVLLYEALTLERPFTGATPPEVFAAIRQGKYAPLRNLRPEIPEGLAAVVDRALSRNPNKRFASASLFASALEPHLGTRLQPSAQLAALVSDLFGATPDPRR